MAKKLILFVFSILIFIGCDMMTMDSLDVVSGTKYIVTTKKKQLNSFYYIYHIIEDGNTWYDYQYKDTANYNVGDTLVLTIKAKGK